MEMDPNLGQPHWQSQEKPRTRRRRPPPPPLSGHSKGCRKLHFLQPQVSAPGDFSSRQLTCEGFSWGSYLSAGAGEGRRSSQERWPGQHAAPSQGETPTLRRAPLPHNHSRPQSGGAAVPEPTSALLEGCGGGGREAAAP